MINPLNISLVAGQATNPQELTLPDTMIQGVVVDNANSPVDLWVYQGPGAQGVPFIVKAGWSRGFSIAPSRQIYFVFNGMPSVNGSSYIAVSDEPQVAFSTQVVTKGSDYPNGAAPFVERLSNGSVVGGGVQIGSSIPITVGQSLWISCFQAWGLELQPWNEWALKSSVAATNVLIINGFGKPDTQALNPPIQIPWGGPANQTTGFFLFATSNDTIIGNWNVDALVVGYVL